MCSTKSVREELCDVSMSKSRSHMLLHYVDDDDDVGVAFSRSLVSTPHHSESQVSADSLGMRLYCDCRPSAQQETKSDTKGQRVARSAAAALLLQAKVCAAIVTLSTKGPRSHVC